MSLKSSNEGLLVLGCPFGSSSYVNSNLENIVKKLSTSVDRLSLVDHKVAYPLTKFCINTRGSYLARVCPPWLLSNFAKEFDLVINNLIAKWCVLPFLDQLSSNMRTLPCGLNLPSLEELSPIAYSNSYANALEKGRKIFEGKLWFWAINFGDNVLSRHSSIINRFIQGFSFANNSYAIASQSELYKKHSEESQNKIVDDLKNNNEKELVSYIYGLIKLYNNSPINCYLSWFNTKRKISDISFSTHSFNDSVRRRLLCNNFILGPNLNCICKKNINPILLNKRSNIFHYLSCSEVSGCTIARHNSIVSLLNLFIKTFIPFAVTQYEFVYINPINNACKKRIDIFIKIPGDNLFGVDVNVFN